MKKNRIRSCLAISLFAAVSVHAGQDHDNFGASSAGAVYTMDNAAGGNNVIAYTRSANGILTPAGTFATGGLGSGGPLASQGAIVLSRNGDWLFVCDAGSDEISVFSVQATGLVLADKVNSGGKQPVSIAVHQNLVYVLNAGGEVGDADNVTGFIFAFGKLLQGPDSTRPLSTGNTAPAQVSFTRDGQALIVTEKATGLIDSFNVTDTGLLDNFQSITSSVATPYGFAVGREDRIFVSQANGGAVNGGTLSSYEISEDGAVKGISSAVQDKETAPCWVVLTRDQQFVYTSNTGSASISGYGVSWNGKLQLLNASGVTGTTGVGPIDLALSKNSQFLYCLNAHDNSISTLQVNANGSLKTVNTTTGLPAGAAGLAAQ